jgi:hypothetical protein
MKTTCLLILENNLDNGSIIIDSNPKDIKQDSFEIELEIETDTPKSFLSLRGLTPGIKADNGLTIKKMIVGGKSVDPALHTSFKMIDNPYVENTIIKESTLVFNGDLSLDIEEEELFWFPHFYSDKKLDFVFQNNLATCQGYEGCWEGEQSRHQDRKLNLPFDPRIGVEKADNIALGCSVTYGSSIPLNQRWPEMLGLKNFGAPGLGIDAIYYNAKRMVDIYQPRSITILFPNMARRLIEFESKGQFFRMSCPYTRKVLDNPLAFLKKFIKGLKNDPIDLDTYQDHFWISRKEIERLTDEKIKEILDDVDYNHSRHNLEKIASLPCEVIVSSWDKETYEILPHYFKKILPFFEKLDTAKDGAHPGPESHKFWAGLVKNTISSITNYKKH